MPKNQPESHKIQAWSLINRKYLGQGVRVKDFAGLNAVKSATVCCLPS